MRVHKNLCIYRYINYISFAGDRMVAKWHVPVRSIGSADQQQPRPGREAEEICEPAGSRGIRRTISHRIAKLSGITRQVMFPAIFFFLSDDPRWIIPLPETKFRFIRY